PCLSVVVFIRVRPCLSVVVFIRVRPCLSVVVFIRVHLCLSVVVFIRVHPCLSVVVFNPCLSVVRLSGDPWLVTGWPWVWRRNIPSGLEHSVLCGSRARRACAFCHRASAARSRARTGDGVRRQPRRMWRQGFRCGSVRSTRRRYP